MIGAKKHTVEEKITKWENRIDYVENVNAEDKDVKEGLTNVINDVLSDLLEIKATEDEMNKTIRRTIHWLKIIEANDQMEANPDATILELEKLL